MDYDGGDVSRFVRRARQGTSTSEIHLNRGMLTAAFRVAAPRLPIRVVSRFVRQPQQGVMPCGKPEPSIHHPWLRHTCLTYNLSM